MKMDVFELIEKDHREVDQLFSEIEATKDSKKRAKLFEQIYQEFNLHAQVEQLTLYPSMREHKETEGFVEEAEEEHAQARILLEELKSLSPTSSDFKEKISKVKDAIQHHVKEEEEEIFPKVRQSLSDQELEQLSEEFQQTKSKLQKDLTTANK